jgi:hypothetical protein
MAGTSTLSDCALVLIDHQVGTMKLIKDDPVRSGDEERAGVLTATNTLIAELAQDWSRPEGRELQKIVRDILPPIV